MDQNGINCNLSLIMKNIYSNKLEANLQLCIFLLKIIRVSISFENLKPFRKLFYKFTFYIFTFKKILFNILVIPFPFKGKFDI